MGLGPLQRVLKRRKKEAQEYLSDHPQQLGKKKLRDLVLPQTEGQRRKQQMLGWGSGGRGPSFTLRAIETALASLEINVENP